MNVERNVRKLKRLLRKNGWAESPSEGKGSHSKFRKGNETITVPMGHDGELPKPLARDIMREAGLIS